MSNSKRIYANSLDALEKCQIAFGICWKLG